MTTHAIDHRQTSAPLIDHELDRVATTLEARFPGVARDEIACVVDQTYRSLVADARITAHLIPLTLNVSRRILAARSSADGLN